MPEYRDRHGDIIGLPGPSPYDGLFGVGAAAILIPASIVLCPMFLLANAILENFNKATLIFCLVSVVVSIVMARLKFRSIIEIVLDALGSFIMFGSYYLIAFMLCIPMERILMWIVLSVLATATVFIRQSIRYIAESAVLGLITGILAFVIIYAVFCFIVVQSPSINSSGVIKAYKLSENNYMCAVIRLLYYLPPIIRANI